MPGYRCHGGGFLFFPVAIYEKPFLAVKTHYPSFRATNSEEARILFLGPYAPLGDIIPRAVVDQAPQLLAQW